MSQTTIDHPGEDVHGDGRRDLDDPDPRQLWAWLGRAVRPHLGWLLVALGVVALVIGYLGVSREVLVARQVPYFVSGGLVGIALVVMGGIAMLIGDLRTANERVTVAERTAEERLAAIETAVAELRDVLLAHPDAPAGATATAGTPADLVALPGGTSYHRPDCRIVAGKPTEAVHAPAATSLTACKLCAPATT